MGTHVIFPRFVRGNGEKGFSGIDNTPFIVRGTSKGTVIGARTVLRAGGIKCGGVNRLGDNRRVIVLPKNPVAAKKPEVKPVVEEVKPEVKPPAPIAVEEPKVEVASVPEVVETAAAEPVAEQGLLVEQPVAEEQPQKKRRKRRSKKAAAAEATAELI